MLRGLFPVQEAHQAGATLYPTQVALHHVALPLPSLALHMPPVQVEVWLRDRREDQEGQNRSCVRSVSQSVSYPGSTAMCYPTATVN